MARRTIKTLTLKRATQSSPTGLAPKLALRRQALDFVGISNARVLDIFAGDGEMFRAVWRHAPAYAGCDLEWRKDGRLIWICDNRRLLRNLDLAAFNVFDLDAFGEPWRQLYILAHRRRLVPHERVAIVVTAGMAKSMISKVPQPGKGSRLDTAFCRLAGVSNNTIGVFQDRETIFARIARNVAGLMQANLAGLHAAASGKGSIRGGKGLGSPVVYALITLDAGATL